MAKPVAKERTARPTTVTESFGELVRATRKQAGLSQLELAQAAGISPKTLTKIEQGDMTRFDSIVRLAQALGKPTDEWVRLAGHKDVSTVKVKNVLGQHRVNPPFPQLTPEQYIVRMIERLQTHGNIGLCCNCITSPVSVATDEIRKRAEEVMDAGLHVAMVVPFPFESENVRRRLPTLWQYYGSAYNWAYQAGNRSRHETPSTRDRIHVFTPRIGPDKETMLVYPPVRVAEVRPVLTQYGRQGNVLYEYGAYLHFFDSREDHWVDIYSGNQLPNESAQETFDMWHDYFRDILLAWRPEGSGRDSTCTFDLKPTAFWQEARFDDVEAAPVM